jgi:hypothetical protein
VEPCAKDEHTIGPPSLTDHNWAHGGVIDASGHFTPLCCLSKPMALVRMYRNRVNKTNRYLQVRTYARKVERCMLWQGLDLAGRQTQHQNHAPLSVAPGKGACENGVLRSSLLMSTLEFFVDSEVMDKLECVQVLVTGDLQCPVC